VRTVKEFRQTVSFRLSRTHLEELDRYEAFYRQGRGAMIREAIQLWLKAQRDRHPLPKLGEAE